jgi:transposase
MYVQRNRSIYKGKGGVSVYKSVLLRECYWDREKKKIAQRTLANLSKLPEYVIRKIELALKEGEVCSEGEEISYKLDDLDFEDAFPYGHIACLDHIIRDIGLDKAIYSKSTKERDLALAMIIARVIYPKSELETMRYILAEEAFREFYDLDYSRLRVDHLYKNLDWLKERQKMIESNLYRLRDEKPYLFLYDITSAYFEGENAELSAFGFNRDKKKGKKQIVIGLVTDREGYPLSIEVFKGNTSDQKTLVPKIKELKERYGLDSGIIVGDRGLITSSKIEKIEEHGFKYIRALTHQAVEKLIEDHSTPFQLGLFDERDLVEIEYKGKRYILCKSPYRRERDKKALDELMEKTRKKLDEIKECVERGKLRKKEKIALRVGRWIGRWKVGKYFDIEIKDGFLDYRIREESLRLKEALCGCYIISTSVPERELGKEEVVEHYKRLSLVERAFEMIKKELLNIQPIYHRKEGRIKAHAFLCMLGYYVALEFKKRMKEIFDENGKGRNYKWTFTSLLQELKKIKLGYMKIKDIRIRQLKELTPTQRKILRSLGIKLRVNKEVIH